MTLTANDKKQSSKKKNTMEDYIQSEGININEITNKMASTRSTSIYFLSSNVKGKLEYELRCSCGHCFLTSDISSKNYYHDQDYQCPKCGKTKKFENISFMDSCDKKGYSSIVVPCPSTGNIALLLIDWTEHYAERAIYNGKEAKIVKMFVITPKGVKDRSDNKRIVPNLVEGLSSDKDIVDIINNSNVKYFGILDAWGLNPEHPERKVENYYQIFIDYNTSYIANVFKYPVIEKIMKVLGGKKTRSLYNKKSNEYNLVDLEKDNVQDALGVSKKILKFLSIEPDVSIQELQQLEQHTVLDPSASLEDILKIMVYEKNENKPYADIIHIAPSMKISKLLEYIDECYLEQCIEKSLSYSIYYDYLVMANDLKYDFSNKNILRPDSLELKHDITQSAHCEIENEIKREKFANTIQGKYEWLKYKNQDYTIIIPASPEEIVAEGVKLNHCVSTYIDRMAKEECIICFMRDNKYLDTPLYTIEVEPSSRKIIQMRGQSNCSLNGDKVFAFIAEWKKYSKLISR